MPSTLQAGYGIQFGLCAFVTEGGHYWWNVAIDTETHCIQFGWLDLALSFERSSLHVIPLPDWSERISYIKNSNVYGRDYLYLPVVPETNTAPLIPAQRMELAPTHLMILHGRGQNTERDLFLTAVLGFLLGLRLVPEGVGHLHRIRHTPRRAVSFFADETEIADIVEAALGVWDARCPSVGNRIFAAMHWYLTSAAGYIHQFERFVFLYSVLDALHVGAWESDVTYCAAHQTKPNVQPHRIAHKERISKLASHFGSPVPDNIDAINGRRNTLLHEARLNGEAIGFSASYEIHDMELSMAFFIEQIILGLLGVECAFRKHQYSPQTSALGVKE